MINVFIREEDGKYNASFSKHYSIGKDLRVWSKRRRIYLAPDPKNRVFLSAGGLKRRVNIKKLREDSLAAMSHLTVKKIVNAVYKDVYLGEYYWRIPTELEFMFDTQRTYSAPTSEFNDSPVMRDRFMRLLTRIDKQTTDKMPTYSQFYHWSRKYVDGLSTIPDGISLYRSLQAPIGHEYQRALQTDKTFLEVYAVGSIMIKKAGGRLTTLRPATHCMTGINFQSSLLANNRLTFSETEGLISGPFKPLLAWVFLGAPQEGQTLFNITGNACDFSVDNYVWLDANKVTACYQMRSWLINRWKYETYR